ASLYPRMLRLEFRCPDPFLQIKGSWTLRRLAPDCSRIELDSLPKAGDVAQLLRSMGMETANVHLSSGKARELKPDLRRRERNWLVDAAERMAHVVRADWKAWKAAAK